MSEISVRAARAASRIGRTLNVALGPSELTPAGYRLLAYLVTGQAAAKALAEKLAVSRPTVTATIDWLEPRGYVTRNPDPSDGRRVEIAITPAGQAALEAADRLVVERLARVTAALEPAELRAIVAALETLGDALDDDRAKNVQAASDGGGVA